MNLSEIATITTLKNTTYVIVFLATIEYLGFNPESVALFTTLMVIDVFTGIVRACAQEGCQSVKSAIGVRGILAKILLLAGIFSVGIAGKGAGFAMQGTLQGVINVLILAELYSVWGNIHSALSGKKKNEFDAVAFILKQIKAALIKYLKP
jgi:small basic protein